MSLAYIGPIAVVIHGNPTFAWTGDSAAVGRQATIGGVLEWDQGKQLVELTDNPARRRTFGAVSGVLEPIWTGDDLLADFVGMYLLQPCQLNPAQVDSLTGLVPFALTAVRLPDQVDALVCRSARARVNAYGLAAKGVVAQPFTGGAFTRSPGGTLITREFDPLAHDSARVSTPSLQMDVYVGTVTSTSDALASAIVCAPVAP